MPSTHYRFSLTLVAVLLLQACVIRINADERSHDVSKVFGGIEVERGRSVGDLESVNGGITLGDGATAKDVETVNGGIRIEDDVTVDSIEAVNGGIRAGVNLSVGGDVTTINGGIQLARGSVIERDVTTVNGQISLTGVKVMRNVETTNGNIELRKGSVVTGSVVFGEDGYKRKSPRHRPTLRVDSSSEIQGSIHLYREVDLHIDDGARVGEIIRHYSQT